MSPATLPTIMMREGSDVVADWDSRGVSLFSCVNIPLEDFVGMGTRFVQLDLSKDTLDVQVHHFLRE